jgi:CheY-like chemotaxis protein
MCSGNMSRQILIVDDEHVIADSLALIFSRCGFQSTAVYSGEEAVEAAEILNPDWLISDVIMGDMNGLDAALRIRRICPGCKIILLSGTMAANEVLNSAPAEGSSFEFHSKPVHPEFLLNRVRNM